MDLDLSNNDEYLLTAHQIFNYCGADDSSTICVDELVDKFAPFFKTNKAEYSHLKSFLDPDRSNPEISASELARALHKYSESQKTKADLEESFNLKTGMVPQDSDSGISTDSFQLQVEDLQCELREKSRQVSQLRSHLDYVDRQHEETLASLTAERDQLRAHLKLSLREENILHTDDLQRDYDEVCERLRTVEGDFDEVKKELDGAKKKVKVTAEQVLALETEKINLQELLNNSKEECHRINVMYASRQSSLIEENESLKCSCADLTTKLNDHQDYLHQIIQEKAALEMELKDMLNSSNFNQLRMERSIDVSFTEDQMLTALDTLNADSKFGTEPHNLEDSFFSSTRADHGRMSLFDEIKHSLGVSRNISIIDEKCKCVKILMHTLSTQTDLSNDSIINSEVKLECTECLQNIEIASKLQNDLAYAQSTLLDVKSEIDKYEDNMQMLQSFVLNDSEHNKKLDLEIDKLNSRLIQLSDAFEEQKCEIDRYLCETSCVTCQTDFSFHTYTSVECQTDDTICNSCAQSQPDVCCAQSQTDVFVLYDTCCAECQTDINVPFDTCCAQYQTDSDVASIGTQIEIPCVECVKRNKPVPNSSWRRFVWDVTKSLFVICSGMFFLSALVVLYNVTNYHYAARRCVRDTSDVPWRWINVQDLLDFIFRIEYLGEVPM